jgi:hypothetical protein
MTLLTPASRRYDRTDGGGGEGCGTKTLITKREARGADSPLPRSDSCRRSASGSQICPAANPSLQWVSRLVAGAGEEAHRIARVCPQRLGIDSRRPEPTPQSRRTSLVHLFLGRLAEPMTREGRDKRRRAVTRRSDSPPSAAAKVREEEGAGAAPRWT